MIARDSCWQLVTSVYITVVIDYPWRRSGTAVQCRTLDRENPVTNPLHMMATRCGGVTPRQYKILACT